MNKILAILTIALFFYTGIKAQSKKNDAIKLDLEYKAESDAMRKFVWGWKDPKFTNYTVPAKYANASKVILAHHTEFNAERKSKVVMTGVLMFDKKINQNISEIVRQVIKLNDKSAVDEYSEFGYTQLERSSGFRKGDVSKVMVGVRIIKPDGKINEVNADEIVLTENSEKQKKAKLAIPDLATGDIIDYYIATVSKTINNITPKEYSLLLFADAPILDYSFHGVMGKKYGVKYRPYNGAANFKLSSNAEEDNVIDFQVKDIPAFETSLWVALPRQLPYVRMRISANPVKEDMGIQQVKDNNEATEEMSLLAKQMRSVIRADKMTIYEYKGYQGAAKDAAEKDGTKFKDLSDKEKAAYLYYALRHFKLLKYYDNGFFELINQPAEEYNGLSIPLVMLFQLADLEPALIGSEDRTGFRFKEAMTRQDLFTTAFIPSINEYFSIKSIFDVPFEIPEEIEGLDDTRMFDLTRGENESKGPKVPVTKSTDNAHLEKYQMKLVFDKNTVDVKRTTKLKGHYKRNMQRELILFEEYDAVESEAVGLKRNLLEEVGKRKNGKQKQEELRNAYAEARKLQQESFLRDNQEMLGLEIKEMKDAKVENMGIRHTKPDFIYSSTFSIDGIVKKAGNNFILEIGKMLGEPLKVKDDQRKREIDIYAPFARSIEQEITIDIPEGYTVEGLASLNTSVKNETGFFIAEATSTDKQVKISVKKHYLHNFEPAANFDKLMEFMNASGDWTSSKLLFKKK